MSQELYAPALGGIMLSIGIKLSIEDFALAFRRLLFIFPLTIYRDSGWIAMSMAISTVSVLYLLQTSAIIRRVHCSVCSETGPWSARCTGLWDVPDLLCWLRFDVLCCRSSALELR